MAANDTAPSVNKEDFENSLREVEALSDEELYDKLKQTGKDIGPVVATTRTFYRKQLALIYSHSPNGNASPSTNGNAEDHNGDVTDSDDASFETSSRASRSSRGSSLPKKNRRSVAPTPTKFTQEERQTVTNGDENFPKRESAFTTPSRPARSFEDYVAESEARKARLGDTYREGSQARATGDREETGRLGILPTLLALALLAVLVGYVYINYSRNFLGGAPDRDSIIDDEIEKITKQH